MEKYTIKELKELTAFLLAVVNSYDEATDDGLGWDDIRHLPQLYQKGKEAWVEPVVEKTAGKTEVHFHVKSGKGKPPEGTVNRRGATCLICGTPMSLDEIRSQGKGNGLGKKLIAIVV